MKIKKNFAIIYLLIMLIIISIIFPIVNKKENFEIINNNIIYDTNFARKFNNIKYGTYKQNERNCMYEKLLNEGYFKNDQTKSCSVDCVLSNWSPWGECSEGSGEGTQTRTRTIITQPQHEGKECGITTETQDCNSVDCVGSWVSLDSDFRESELNGFIGSLCAWGNGLPTYSLLNECCYLNNIRSNNQGNCNTCNKLKNYGVQCDDIFYDYTNPTNPIYKPFSYWCPKTCTQDGKTKYSEKYIISTPSVGSGTECSNNNNDIK